MCTTLVIQNIWERQLSRVAPFTDAAATFDTFWVVVSLVEAAVDVLFCFVQSVEISVFCLVCLLSCYCSRVVYYLV